MGAETPGPDSGSTALSALPARPRRPGPQQPTDEGRPPLDPANGERQTKGVAASLLARPWACLPPSEARPRLEARAASGAWNPFLPRCPSASSVTREVAGPAACSWALRAPTQTALNEVIRVKG